MTIKHLCLDLDGTIVNSFPTINKCTIRTLQHFNISKAYEEQKFYNLIGHHFQDIFSELSIEIPDIENFIDVYKTYYFDYINESVLYPGVADTLVLLKQRGIKISLLTTKAQDQADNIIDHFNLRRYFDSVYGRRPGLGIKPDPEPLLAICSELNILPAYTLMTGDSDLDIKCGRNAGTLTCGVTYGYRTREILNMEGPDYLIDNISDLADIIR